MISVVIPTLNNRELLRGCLDSLLAQRRRADEILVVDNGSEDGTGEMVRREFAGRARLLIEPRTGVHHARNRGIAEASGDIVAFTDDDVLLPPGWLEALAGCFEDPGVAGAGGPTRAVWPAGRDLPSALRSGRGRSLLGIVDFGPVRKPLDPAREYLLGANCAYRKALVTGEDGFRGIFPCPGLGVCGDDWELSQRIARRHVVLYEPAAYVDHRIAPSKARWTHLLRRAFYYEAARARHGGGFKPKRGPRELLGAEGVVSLAVAIGYFFGRFTRAIRIR